MAGKLFHGRTLVAAVSISAVLSAGAASAGTVWINGHQIKPHTVDAKALTPAAVKYLRGLRGASGPMGPMGAAGATGAAGSTGSTGSTGTTGAPGATGATGAPGAPGANGFSVADHAAITSPFTESTGTSSSQVAVPLTTNTWTQAANETDFGPMGSITYTVGNASGAGSVAACNQQNTPSNAATAGGYPANSTITQAWTSGGIYAYLDGSSNGDVYAADYLNTDGSTHTDILNNQSVLPRPTAATPHSVTAKAFAECDVQTYSTDANGYTTGSSTGWTSTAMPLTINAYQLDTMAGVGK